MSRPCPETSARRTGTTVESGSGVDMRIMSGSNPHVHDDAQCEVRGLSGSANDCEDDKESRKGASADGKLPEPADATNEPEGSAGVGESCKGCQWVGRDGERGDERHQHTDKTRQHREQSTNVPYDSPEPPWPPNIPTNHASEPTTRQEASIEGENGHVGAQTINDRGREKEVRASRWKSRRTKRRCCHGQDAATSAARCESKRLEMDALAGYKASQHGKHNRTTADVPEVSKPPHNHHSVGIIHTHKWATKWQNESKCIYFPSKKLYLSECSKEQLEIYMNNDERVRALTSIDSSTTIFTNRGLGMLLDRL
ncbi:hypothetical protein L210DRAFT_3505897 [Boletus edulis BED1]|uniref:Uncharacterized protein n=1 Tax=Boletus edulis BED1 TaxID=1328754 RepID=A0AAD4BP74_BOLED|nr:hypothetical protein L210DRAFT_3505897 [Boletus edulis BED1]